MEDFTPNVIEPSFGLGRILYALLEHSYWARESDINRGVLSLPPLVAPVKVLIVPISSHDTFDPLIKEICTADYVCISMHTADSGPQPPNYARLVSFRR